MVLIEVNEDTNNDTFFNCRNFPHQELLDDVLNCIAKSPAVFKSQQIDDPDLTEAEKRLHAEAVLNENPVTFLERFGKYLNDCHLQLFDDYKDEDNSYDIEHYVKQFRAVLNGSHKALIRNRRYEALTRLEYDGKYFSESEMEKREPLLYHQLVGQYLSANEKKSRLAEGAPKRIPTFFSFMMQQAERDEVSALRRRQEEEEANEKASSDDDSQFEPVTPPKIAKWGADWEDEETEKTRKNVWKKAAVKITDEEKSLLLQEFISQLKSKFLDGLDVDFDYSTVDNNPEYDCIMIRFQDDEDKFFDAEPASGSFSTDTGIDDY